MSKLHSIKDKEIVLYRLVKDNYVGLTTNLHKRLLKHRSKSKYDISNVEILETTRDLDYALKKELYYQNVYECTKGVRNQEGSKNPYAKQVLCLKNGIFYDTIKEACEANGYSYSLVRRKIKDNSNKFLLIRL